MNHAIFDLDGCLADDRRRQPLIDLTAKDPWAAYHAGCDEDPLINSPLLKLAPDNFPVFFTARPESVREKTLSWLTSTCGIHSGLLFMRAQNCRKGSPELKAHFLARLFRMGITPRDIVCAFDDREDVLAIYELYGIRTIKVGYPSEVNSNA